ncbi:hypothetical protein [Corynebacterium lujinxingii]|uniref:Uncharacterized protein n=1 Tax=Corynebacterium lujinxingii TaxID=2763010 RepID=A0A7H0JX06_9CORY|nr:hypothetical protein [Corynebacterium lujinxingii]MBC3178007.1 hypothetical protein [Corynebacterium lujinxingii]NNO09751.1 hypothetical protein [Corynebacterium lujinxingii]QNP89572.1 hypothetical protein IAU68_07635 [Corynebacterium lujinxingii]
MDMSISRGFAAASVLALALFTGGCSTSADLSGTYTKVESAGEEKLTSTLTIDGSDCTFHHVAEPGDVEDNEVCTVDGDNLVFTKDGAETRLPVIETDGGDLQIGLGDGELYQKSH